MKNTFENSVYSEEYTIPILLLPAKIAFCLQARVCAGPGVSNLFMLPVT
jgi:hypothetical protein